MGCSSSTDSIVLKEDDLSTNNLESTFVIWLNSSPDQNSIKQLQQSVNNLKIFNNNAKCLEFLNQIENERIFLIISNVVNQQELFQFEKHCSIQSIYFLSNQIIKTSPKIEGSFDKIDSIIPILKQDIEQTERSLISMTTIHSIVLTDIGIADLSFLFFYILKQTIETTNIHSSNKKQFIDFYRKQSNGNNYFIEKFNQNYNNSTAAQFYIEEYSISSILNKSLRTENIDFIFEIYFLMRDLTKQIQCETNQQLSNVYRAQSISIEYLNKIQQSLNGFICFNTFLLANSNPKSQFDLARQIQRKNLISIIFEIQINSRLSVCSNENILFAYLTIFQIKKIEKLENNLFQINLMEINYNDERLKKFNEDFQRTLPGSSALSRLANFKLKTGNLKQSLSIYKILLELTSEKDTQMLAHVHNQLGFLYDGLKETKQAKFHYEKSIAFYSSYLPPFDPTLSSSYSNLAIVLKEERDFDGALKYQQHALNIDLQADQPDYEQITNRYNNIGVLFRTQEKYDEAMKNYQTALKIGLENLANDHPTIATTYNNIADIYRIQEDYQTALELYGKTLEIETKVLAPKHPSLAITCFNIAITLDCLNRIQEAIEYANKALDISQHVYGNQHSEVEEKQRFIDSLRQKL